MTTQTTRTANSTSIGVASIGLAFPSLAMPVTELAALRGVDPQKLTIGLGCREMALCAEDEGVVDLATRAAERALERWGGDREGIGMIVVGTESAVDMSRPLSAFVADRLGLAGTVRSYEVKHACYGGTLALRQAVEWKMSGAAGAVDVGKTVDGGKTKAALVIAADVALYAVADPGEPTQGAGAVAFVVDEARVASIDLASFPWSEPVFDFWRPVGEDHPRVDGPLSLDCYKRGAEKCFGAYAEAGGDLDAFDAVCCHVPFPKMVKKAILHMGESRGWDAERGAAYYAEKVEPSMDWNQATGNSYTAALWVAVARALVGRAEGESLAAFSYGSGFGAELLTLVAGPEAREAAWQADVDEDFANREMLDAAAYAALRGERVAQRAA